MARVALRLWDPATELRTDEDRADFLEAALDEDHPETVIGILGHIARSKGMEKEALAAGLPPEALDLQKKIESTLDLAAVLAIVKVLGLKLHAGKA